MLSTERFSSRVENYLKYRPHYPSEVLTILEHETGLLPKHVIADIGSGTGFSAELFLQNGNTVYGIEPNKEMREAGERYLRTHKNFRSIAGTAEATTLPDHSVDYILAGQAFHWFDPSAARREFKRILKPGGWVLLLWNDRQYDTTPFLNDYEQLLQDFGTDYNEVNHRNIDAERIQDFFAEQPVQKFEVQYIQRVDFEGLRGRLLSSSYVPEPESPNYQPMLDRLREIYDRHASHGTVDIIYTTLLYLGQL